MTTRRLVLIRHAKAKQDSPDLVRPLSSRGQADAAAIGRWLASRGIAPDRVVVSPARRTQQTWSLASAGLSAATAEDDERVYAARRDELLEVIRESPGRVHTLAIVGHNPSMEELSLALDDGSGDPAAVGEWGHRFPTSGVAVFTIGCRWSDVASGSGRLDHFAAPRGDA